MRNAINAEQYKGMRGTGEKCGTGDGTDRNYQEPSWNSCIYAEPMRNGQINNTYMLAITDSDFLI